MGMYTLTHSLYHPQDFFATLGSEEGMGRIPQLVGLSFEFSTPVA